MAEAKTVNLGYYPRDWQRQVHERRKRFNVFALHRRAGKTHGALMQMVDDALRCTRPLPMFAYVAPFLKQAKFIAWVRLKQILRPLIDNGVCEQPNESELSIKFTHNGATIRLFGADNADALRGGYLDGVVLDEVAQMDPEVWHEIVRPMLADRKGWAWFIGTPNGVNLFSQLYFDAVKDPANWHRAVYTVYDTNALEPDEVALLKSSMAPQAFAREMLCDFSAAGDNQLISLGDVIAAQQRQIQYQDYSFAPRIIGVDPARFGSDRSVIAMRQGLKVEPPVVLTKVDNMTLADRILDLKQRWQADAIFCDAGQGAGVIDRLRQLGHDVVEVHFGGKPVHPRFRFKRDEIWSDMADMVPMLSLPESIELQRDLAAPTYKFMPDGRKTIESKDELRERGIPSPDIGDALALTWAAPVDKKTPKEAWMDQMERLAAQAEHNYDPYSGQVTEYDPYAPTS